jgi:hypothetical protein
MHKSESLVELKEFREAVSKFELVAVRAPETVLEDR